MKKQVILLICISIVLIFAEAVFGWNWWHTPYSEDYMPIEMWAQQGGTCDCSGSTEFSAFIRAGLTWNSVEDIYFMFTKGGFMSGGQAKDGIFNISFSYS
jgi:hypothetical protein